jgi:hypothetical protein
MNTIAQLGRRAAQQTVKAAQQPLNNLGNPGSYPDATGQPDTPWERQPSKAQNDPYEGFNWDRQLDNDYWKNMAYTPPNSPFTVSNSELEALPALNTAPGPPIQIKQQQFLPTGGPTQYERNQQLGGPTPFKPIGQ